MRSPYPTLRRRSAVSTAPLGCQGEIRTAVKTVLTDQRATSAAWSRCRTTVIGPMAYSARDMVILALNGQDRIATRLCGVRHFTFPYNRHCTHTQHALRRSPASRSPAACRTIPWSAAQCIESHGVQRVRCSHAAVSSSGQHRGTQARQCRAAIGPARTRCASLSESGPQRLLGLAGEVRVVDRSLERLQRRDHGRWVAAGRRDEERRAAWLQRIAHVFDELLIDSGVHHLPDGRATGRAENQATDREQDPPDDQSEHAADGGASFHRTTRPDYRRGPCRPRRAGSPPCPRCSGDRPSRCFAVRSAASRASFSSSNVKTTSAKPWPSMEYPPSVSSPSWLPDAMTLDAVAKEWAHVRNPDVRSLIVF